LAAVLFHGALIAFLIFGMRDGLSREFKTGGARKSQIDLRSPGCCVTFPVQPTLELGQDQLCTRDYRYAVCASPSSPMLVCLGPCGSFTIVIGKAHEDLPDFGMACRFGGGAGFLRLCVPMLGIIE
jgi:hypothetical protein